MHWTTDGSGSGNGTDNATAGGDAKLRSRIPPLTATRKTLLHKHKYNNDWNLNYDMLSNNGWYFNRYKCNWDLFQQIHIYNIKHIVHLNRNRYTIFIYCPLRFIDNKFSVRVEKSRLK